MTFLLTHFQIADAAVERAHYPQGESHAVRSQRDNHQAGGCGGDPAGAGGSSETLWLPRAHRSRAGRPGAEKM